MRVTRLYNIAEYCLDCSLKALSTGVEVVRVTHCLGNFATLLRKKFPQFTKLISTVFRYIQFGHQRNVWVSSK